MRASIIAAGLGLAVGLLPGLGVTSHADEVTGPPLYRIVAEWAGPDDVDLFTSNPDRKVAWYYQRKHKDMELIRDGRGYLPSGADLPPLPNREETVIRGGTPGRYAASVYLFESRSKEAVLVSVRLETIGPPVEILHEGTLKLRRGDERSIGSFRLDRAGTMTSLSTRPVKVVDLVRFKYGEAGGPCPLNWNPDVPCWAEEARN